MIRPAGGFGPEGGFEEGKIPGAAQLRQQAEALLPKKEDEVVKVEILAKEAVQITDPAKRVEYIQKAQTEIDNDFDASGVKEMLEKALPYGTDAADFQNQLKEEWHTEFNVKARTDALQAEAETAKLAKPEELVKPKVKKGGLGEAPPPAAPPPGGEAPAASPFGDLSDDFKKIIEKFLEEFQKNQGGGDISQQRTHVRQSTFSDETLGILARWDGASGEEKLALYKQLEVAMGVSSEKPKGEEEEPLQQQTISKLMKKAEAAGPPLAAKGAAEAEKPKAVRGAAPPPQAEGPPPPQATPVNIVSEMRKCIASIWPEGWPIRYEGLGWVLDQIANNPQLSLAEQIKWLQDFGNQTLKDNPSWYSTAGAGQKYLFQALTMATDSRCFKDALEFGKIIKNIALWGATGTQQSIIVNALFANKLAYTQGVNFFTCVAMCMNEPARYTFTAFRDNYLKDYFFNTEAFGKMPDGRINPYFKFPGITKENIEALWKGIGTTMPFPAPVPLDEAFTKVYNWRYNDSVHPDDIEMVDALLNKIKELERGGFKDLSKLTEWADGYIRQEYSMFTDSTTAGRILFMEITKNTLADFKDKIANWGKPGSPEEALRNDLIKILSGLPAGKSIVDLQNILKVRYGTENIYFMFGGITRGALSDIFNRIGGLDVPPWPSPMALKLQDIWNWKQNGPDKELAEWLFNQMFVNPKEEDPSKMERKFGDLAALKSWATDLIKKPTEDFTKVYSKASAAGQVEFKRITGSTITPEEEALRKWADKLPPYLSSFGKMILQELEDSGGNWTTFVEACKRRYFNIGDMAHFIYAANPGLVYEDMKALAGILKITDERLIPKPTLAEKLLAQLYIYAKRDGASKGCDALFRALTNQLVLYCATDNKDELNKALNNWLREQLKPDPYAGDFWTRYKGITFTEAAYFEQITGLRLPPSLEFILEKVSKWEPSKTQPASSGETDFKNKLLEEIQKAIKEGISVADFQKRLQDTFFKPTNIYWIYGGLTEARALELCGLIGGVTPNRMTSLDKLYLEAIKWDQPSGSNRMAFYLVSKINALEAKISPNDPEAEKKGNDLWKGFQDSLKTLWQNPGSDPDFADALAKSTPAQRAEFMQRTGVQALDGLRDRITEWAKTASGPEKDFINALLEDIKKNTGKKEDEFREFLKTTYFDTKNSIYIRFPGITEARLKLLCTGANGLGFPSSPPPPEPSALDRAFFKVLDWVKDKVPDLKLAEFLRDMMRVNGVSKFATYEDFQKAVRVEITKPPLNTMLLEASGPGLIKFIDVTGVNPALEDILKKVKDWPTGDNLARANFKAKLVELIEKAQKAGDSTATFIGKLNDYFKTVNVYTEFVGLTSADVNYVCNEVLKGYGVTGRTAKPLDEVVWNSHWWGLKYDVDHKIALELFQHAYDLDKAGKSIDDLHVWLRGVWNSVPLPEFLSTATENGRRVFIAYSKYQPLSEIRKSIENWKPTTPGPDADLKSALLAYIDKLITDKKTFSPDELRKDLATNFFKDIYYKFPGVSAAGLKAACEAIKGITPPPFTTIDEAYLKVFNWVKEGKTDPALAKFLSEMMWDPAKGISKFANFADFQKAIRAAISTQPLAGYLENITPAGLVKFRDVTGVNPIDAILENVKNWQAAKSPPAPPGEAKLKEDLINLIQTAIRDGKTVKELRESILTYITRVNIYINHNYVGITYARALDLLGITGVKPIDPTAFDNVFMQSFAWNWQKDSNWPLANYLYLQLCNIAPMPGTWQEKMKALSDWAKGLWKNPPKEFTDALNRADAAGKAEFMRLTGVGSLDDLRDRLTKWMDNAAGPEKDFIKALLEDIKTNSTMSEAQFRTFLQGKYFNTSIGQNIYFRFPGITEAGLKNICLSKDGLGFPSSPPPPDARPLDKLLIELWKWENGSTGDEQKLAHWLIYDFMRTGADGDRSKFGTIENFYNALRSMWSGTLPPELSKVSNEVRARFIEKTGFDPRLDLIESIKNWGTGAEATFRDALIKFLRTVPSGLTPAEFQTRIFDEFFNNAKGKYVFANYPGLTEARLQELLNFPFIQGTKLPTPSAMESILLRMMVYPTTSNAGAFLISQLLEQLKAHPEWTLDGLKNSPWWVGITKDAAVFWRTFEGLTATEILDFQSITKLTIPRYPSDLWGIRDAIAGWNVKAGSPEEKLKLALLAFIDRNIFDKDSKIKTPDQLRAALVTEFFNKGIYFAYPGITDTILGVLCKDIIKYTTTPPPPTPTDLDKAFIKVCEWKARGGPDSALANFLYKFMLDETTQPPTSKFADMTAFKAWITKEWENPSSEFLDILKTKSTADGRRELMGITDYNPMSDIQDRFSKWQPTSDWEKALKAALNQILGRTASDFSGPYILRERIAEIFKKDIYFQFPGATFTSLTTIFDNLFGVGKITVPPQSPLDDAFLKVLEWTTRKPPDRDAALAQWLYNQMITGDNTSKFADFAAFQNWMKNLWANPTADFTNILKVSSANGINNLIAITGFDPLADIRKAINDWQVTPGSIEESLKTDLLNYLTANPKGSAQMLADLKANFFNSGIYFKYAGLTDTSVNAICGTLGIDTVKPSAMDRIVWQVANHKAANADGEAFFKMLLAKILEKGPTWPFEGAPGQDTFSAWWSTMTPDAFWKAYPNFSKADSDAFHTITGTLFIPIRPDPIGPVKNAIDAYINNIIRIWNVIRNKYAFGDLQNLRPDQWERVWQDIQNVNLNQLYPGRISKADNDMIKDLFGPPRPAAHTHTSNGIFKFLLAVQAQTTKFEYSRDFFDWLGKVDLAQYPGVSVKDRDDLIKRLKPA